MNNQKPDVILENGTVANCLEPVVVSASRSTDIPAFYCDWFFHRLRVGYSAWTNPFNGARMYVNYAKTRFIVFWSKNPRPLLDHVEELRERGVGCYVQYTLNDYEGEGLERGVPPISERMDTFKRLVETLGFGGVIWRFDPLVLTDDIDMDKLLRKIEHIGDRLKGYTEKLVFSFADIALYRKVKSNMEANGVHYREWTEGQMTEFAARLVALNKDKGWNYELATCGERGRFPGVVPNHCVDDALIIRRAYHDKVLMDFLHARISTMPEMDLFGVPIPLPPGAIVLNDTLYAMRGDNKDKGQREFCGCMKSKDIGQYNTCIHMCEYCYANANKQTAAKNHQCHMQNPRAETITGK